ncbi:MAG: hypothetical protein NC925_01065 [Candidatus Omnitrophica bacterium]|nr:hypothetical protein [Candidatus Omnitrophota bacterium]MCM8831820.1 hypothetical protein [Candidatus Omnitrophota bacterium]
MSLKRRQIAPIGELFVKLNKITKEQLLEALKFQNEKYPNKNIGAILVDLGYITEEELYFILALQFLYPYVELKNYKLDEKIIALLPKEIAHKYKVIPLDRFGNILTVAMFNPIDTKAIEEIEKITGLKVRTFVVKKHEIEEVLHLIYH